MTDEELITFVTDVANQVREAKGYAVHIKESDTRDIIEAVRFINKIKEAVKK